MPLQVASPGVETSQQQLHDSSGFLGDCHEDMWRLTRNKTLPSESAPSYISIRHLTVAASCINSAALDPPRE